MQYTSLAECERIAGSHWLRMDTGLTDKVVDGIAKFVKGPGRIHLGQFTEPSDVIRELTQVLVYAQKHACTCAMEIPR